MLNLTTGISGVLHTVNAGSTTCNGRLAAINQNDPYVTIGECVHVEDVANTELRDSTNPPAS